MDEELFQLVWERANGICEYCLLPQKCSHLTFEVDHIIAICHGGATRPNNLALSCFYCNRYKGPKIAGVDPRFGEIITLVSSAPMLCSKAANGNGKDDPASLRGHVPCGRGQKGASAWAISPGV
jgi:hypothetical protein